MDMHTNSGKPDLIISVESRKGGVGKTTAALCLAKLLLKQHYAVLFLDLDITGTNAIDFANFPFWKNDIHAVSEIGIGCDISNSNPHPINLIELFNDQFMMGEQIPNFALGSPEEQSSQLSMDIKKINAIGSQLYSSNSSTSNLFCIGKPSILFDDIHAFWIIELIRKLVDNFSNVVTSGSVKKVAIVLDNSPGYVGLSPAIHDWMTDNGPVKSKFLIVSSLDVQDLKACNKAASNIHSEFNSKWKTCLYFKDLIEENKISYSPEISEQFLLRLSSFIESPCTDCESLSFYSLTRNKDNCEEQQSLHDKEAYLFNAKQYMGAVINRVPVSVKKGLYSFSLPEEISNRNSVLGPLLSTSGNGNIDINVTIPYDEYIDHQFSIPFIVSQQYKTRIEDLRLQNALEMTEKVVFDYLAITLPPPIRSFDNMIIEFIWKPEALNYVSSTIQQTLFELGSGKYEYLMRLIHKNWLPDSIVPKFRIALSKTLRKMGNPYFDMVARDIFTTKSINEIDSVKVFSKQVRDHLVNLKFSDNIRRNQSTKFLIDLSPILESFFAVSPWIRERIDDFIFLFNAIVTIENIRWNQAYYKYPEEFDIARFLANEIDVQNNTIKQSLGEQYGFLRRINDAPVANPAVLFELYRACVTAQSRIITFGQDALFLIKLLRFIVSHSEEFESASTPFIRDISEDVIISKKISPEDGESMLSQALRTKGYYSDFEQTLSNILRNWDCI